VVGRREYKNVIITSQVQNIKNRGDRMVNFNKVHETQPDKQNDPNDTYVDNLLAGYQKIEGGGPIKKINLKAMPTPVRYFGYFFITVAVSMVLILIGISIFK
jgi:hypothetical protein